MRQVTLVPDDNNNLWRKRLADRREWTLIVRQALATVAALARHS